MDTQEVLIRPFELADIPPLIDLERSVFGSGTYSPYIFRQLYDLFPEMLWVAECGGRIVGHVCGALAQDRQTGWILNFAVQAHYRRQGIGRLLLERCIDQLTQAGAQIIKLTAEPENGPTLRLCEKLGFEQTEVVENYYGEGNERLILAQHIGQGG